MNNLYLEPKTLGVLKFHFSLSLKPKFQISINPWCQNLTLSVPKISFPLKAKFEIPLNPHCQNSRCQNFISFFSNYGAKIFVHDFRLLHLPNVFNHCVCEVVVVGGVCGRQRVLRRFEGGTLFFLFIIFYFSSLKMFLITDFTLKLC